MDTTLEKVLRDLADASVGIIEFDFRAQNDASITFNTSKLAVSEILMRYKAAQATLDRLGYTYHGGELFKPPLGDGK